MLLFSHSPCLQLPVAEEVAAAVVRMEAVLEEAEALAEADLHPAAWVLLQVREELPAA